MDGEQIASRLARSFVLRVPDVGAFARTTRVLPLVHRTTGLEVDLVLGSPGLESWFLERAETMDVEGTAVRVPLAEDLVAMKLISGRPRDLEDVVELIAFDPKAIDLASVRSLLAEIESGVGEEGFVSALDAIVARLAARPARARSKPRRPPRR
jgi:hypothetical protein